MSDLPHHHQKSAHSPRRKRPSAKKIRWIGPAFIGIVLLATGGLLLYAFVWPAVRVVRARNWCQTPCRITSSNVVTRAGPQMLGYRMALSELEITFSYQADGTEYESNRCAFGGIVSHAGKCAFVLRYPEGKETVCYVNRTNPTDAILDRSFRPIILTGLICVGLMMVTWGPLLYPEISRAVKRRRIAGHPVSR